MTTTDTATTRGPIDFGDLLIAVAETLDDIRCCICCGNDSTWAGLYVHDLGTVTVSAWCNGPDCEHDRTLTGEQEHVLALPIDHLPGLRRPVVTEPRAMCEPLPADEPEPHPCGHVERTTGCGGCDPGAIEYVIEGGTLRRFDPARDMAPPIPLGTCLRCRHTSHDSLGFCPNMASDGDCACPGSTSDRTAVGQ